MNDSNGSPPMRIFLDDERPTPQGWVRAYWPEEVIALLEAGGVAEVSLDHDLGNDARGTGYDVVLWVEEAVATRGFVPPKLVVHSANPSARARMEQGIATIERLMQPQTAAQVASWRHRSEPSALTPCPSCANTTTLRIATLSSLCGAP